MRRPGSGSRSTRTSSCPSPGEASARKPARSGHGGGDYFVARDFVRAILDDRDPPIDVYRALDFTAPGLVSEESDRAGRGPAPGAGLPIASSGAREKVRGWQG